METAHSKILLNREMGRVQRQEELERDKSAEEIKDPFQFRNNIQQSEENSDNKKIFGVKKEQKALSRTKNMRIIDEQTLKDLNVEFIIQQETYRPYGTKEKIFQTQLIRTTD